MQTVLQCLSFAAACFTLSRALSVQGGTLSSDIVNANDRFLLASFPDLRQVAYTILPDNIWRPIVIGEVASPSAVAVDSQAQTLYIADTPKFVIWVLRLGVTSDGLLRSIGLPKAAVEGFSAHWLSVNSGGDLYFSGHKQVENGTNASSDSIWRMDADQIATGDTFNPTEVYSSANTGEPNPAIYQLSAVEVDDFYIYWGNQAGGKEHGSVCKATRTNIGVASAQRSIDIIDSALDEVRGIACSATELYWLAPEGLYGSTKTNTNELQDVSQGLMASPPSSSWSPMDLEWDGNTMLYITDAGSGAIYTCPASSSLSGMNLTKYSDAPFVRGIAIMSANHASSISNGKSLGSSATASGRVPLALLFIIVVLAVHTLR